LRFRSKPAYYARNMRSIGPYTRRGVLDKLDRRTAEARFLRDVRAELAQHVGGKPSATQRAMIDRASWLRLHIRLMDNKTAEGRALTEHDSRTYLAWVNSLRLMMEALGPAMPLPDAKPATLKDLLAQRQAAAS